MYPFLWLTNPKNSLLVQVIPAWQLELFLISCVSETKNSLFTSRWERITLPWIKSEKKLLMHFAEEEKTYIYSSNYIKLQGEKYIPVLVICLFIVCAFESIHTSSHTLFFCTPWCVITLSPSIRIQPVFSPSLSFPSLIPLYSFLKLPRDFSFATEIAALELAGVTVQWGGGGEKEKNCGLFDCVCLAGPSRLFLFYGNLLFFSPYFGDFHGVV